MVRDYPTESFMKMISSIDQQSLHVSTGDLEQTAGMHRTTGN